MNIIIPMAGLGSRFSDYGFTINKYLLPINKQLDTMIEKAILSLCIPADCHFILIIREENCIDQPLRDLIHKICTQNNYKYTILSTNTVTEGPTCTSYLAKELIDNDTPLIISNSDQILDWNYSSFIDRASTFDGCVLTYTPTYPITIGQKDKHSFVKFNEDGIPIQYIEKIAISNEALVGTHYYKKGSLFIEAAEYTFRNNIRAPNGEFYISYTYQALLDMGLTTGTYRLTDSEHFYPVGEPGDYFTYYNTHGNGAFHHENDINVIATLTDNRLAVRSTSECADEPIITIGDNTIHIDRYIITVNGMKAMQNILPFQSYIRGWLIGDFEPSIVRTKDFEVGILTHKAGEKWPFHYHAHLDEINLLIKGEMRINNCNVSAGDVFVFNKNMISCPIFIEDCTVLCVKIPSLPKDKILL